MDKDNLNIIIVGQGEVGKVIYDIENTHIASCDPVITDKERGLIIHNPIPCEQSNISEEPILYKRSPVMQSHSDEKKFVCKGKHQYREIVERDGSIISSKWVCECGRSL